MLFYTRSVGRLLYAGYHRSEGLPVLGEFGIRVLDAVMWFGKRSADDVGGLRGEELHAV